MTLEVNDITVIHIDKTPIAVESLSDSTKHLVDIYNHYRREENGAKLELMKVQAAMRDISREIVLNYKKEQEQVNPVSGQTAPTPAPVQQSAPNSQNGDSEVV